MTMTRFSPWLLILLLASFPARAETLYVSDQLSIPLRSGDTMQHRILKFLKSGTRLEVLETNDAGSHYRVKVVDTGREGWVEAGKLMREPGARVQLAALNKQLASLKGDVKAKNQRIAELQENIRQLQQKNHQLEQRGQRQSQQLDELKRVAAKPVQLAKANMQLKNELDGLRREMDRVVGENARLSDSAIREWFLIGGGVSLVSLFFGLIIPNIRWRRKKDSWGGGF